MPAFARSAAARSPTSRSRCIADGIKSALEVGDKLPDANAARLRADQGDGAQSAPGSRERGAKVFARACAGCHGDRRRRASGDGDRRGAINDPAFLALISDQALRRIIITGRPDLGMPTFAERRRPPGRFPAAHVGRDRRPGRAAGRLASTSAQRPAINRMIQPMRSRDMDHGHNSTPAPPRTPTPPAGAAFLRLADRQSSARSRPRCSASRSSATSSGCASARCIGSTWDRVADFPLDETRLVDLRQSARANRGTASRRTPASTSATRARDDQASDQFLVLSVNCAHLGCPVTWFPQSGLFMCPCHGGVYYAERRARLRPAAARLVPLRVARARTGQLRDPGAALSDAAGHARPNTA